MAYSPIAQRSYVFGGVNTSSVAVNTFYEIEATASAVTVTAKATGPSARLNAGLCFDPISGNLILFGGRDTPNGSAALADTWSYATGTNTWTELNPLQDPLKRAHRHVLVQCGFDGNLTLLIGLNSNVGAAATYEQFLWKWNGTTWFK